MLTELCEILSLQTRVYDILREAINYASRKPTILKFDIPIKLSKQGVAMAGSVSFTDDHDLRIPLKWADDVGAVHPLLTGTVITSSDPAVISGGDVSADGTSIVLRSAGDGTCDVTVSNGALHDTITVTVGAPVASSLVVDAADATPVARGASA